MNKIALFHPWIKSQGGSERVILEILKVKNRKADLYTWVYDKENTFDEFKNFNVIELGPKFLKKFSRNFVLRGLFLLSAIFSKIPLKDYDLFLVSSSGVGEFILFRNYLPGKTYAYIHTPLRAASKDVYNWTMKYQYSNFFSRFIYFIAVKIYNLFEKIAWRRIDYPIFNSSLSKQRAIDKKLIKGKKTFIVYPPIDVSTFSGLKIKDQKYFLYVSRFNPNKRQDLVLKAWAKMNHKGYKLVFIGGLENKNYFDKCSKISKSLKNVEIFTNLSVEKRNELYAKSSCGIFLGYKEDFGIVPFEYLAVKKPTILVDGCGYMDILKNSKDVYIVKESNLEQDLENAMKSYIVSPKIVSNNAYIKSLDTRNFIKELELILK